MNAQADWWLLLLGLGLGAGLTWLVLAEMRRHDDDVAAEERTLEATWIAGTLSASGTEADAAGVEEVLRLHRLYLASLPFDEPAWVSGTPAWPVPEEAPERPDVPEEAPEPNHVSASEAAPVATPPSAVDMPLSAGDTPPVEGDRAEREPSE